MLSLVRTSDPALETVNPTEFALWQGGAVAADANWVAAHVPLIRDQFERDLGRCFITSSWTLTLDECDLDEPDGSERSEILLPMVPLVSVTSITYVDNDGVTSTWSSDNYDVIGGEQGRICLKYGCYWPMPSMGLRRYACMTISFTAGYGATVTTIPGALRLGLRELVAFWYANRGEGYVLGRTASPDGALDVRPVPRAVERVMARLQAYRNPVLL